MNVLELLQRQVAERPTAIAMVDSHRGRRRQTTFAELANTSARVAGWLRRLGLGAGDPVLIFQPMSAELYTILLALFRLRAVAMFLDPAVGREHMARCCAFQPPRAFIAAPRAHLLRWLVPELRRIPLQIVIGSWLPGTHSWRGAALAEPLAELPGTAPETPALLTFTSGSTGQPRAAVRSHGFLLKQHEVLQHSLQLTPGAVDLTTLPIVLLANLAAGVTSVIPRGDLRRPGDINPGPVLAQMASEGVVSSTASPAFFEQLARHAARTEQTLPHLRKLFTGGAPVFPRLLDQLQALAPSAEVVAVYGSTEAEPIAHIGRREISSADQSAMLAGQGLLAGRPSDAIQLRILRDRWGRPAGPFTVDEFTHGCQPTGQAGEIVVAGAHVLPGYLHGQGDAETKFRVNDQVWHRTGDAGWLDSAGRLWLLGRCSARLEDREGVIYPFAVECVAYRQPQVKRAALVATRGRRLLAVEGYHHSDPPDLAALRMDLAWAAIAEVRLYRKLPVDRRHNAKIDYPALYRLLGEKRDNRPSQ